MITAVAIRFRGKVWSLPAPARHHHVIELIVKETGVDHVQAPEDDQGFLDDRGIYYRRRPALAHALRCEQVKDPSKVLHGKLFSEDVW